MPLSRSAIGNKRNRLPTTGGGSGFTASWTNSPSASAPSFGSWACIITEEYRSVRIRHRHRLPSPGGSGSDLREPDPHRHPEREAGPYRHVFGKETARQLPG